MKTYNRLRMLIRNQRGVTAIIIGILIVVVFSIVAFAIDIGYFFVTKNELQNVSDAAALAAARLLGEQYFDGSRSSTGADDAVIQRAKDTAYNNEAANKNIIIDTTDVLIGDWEFSPSPPHFVYPPTSDSPNAVKVTARRDSVTNGPISTFFANVMGISTMSAQKPAIAAITGICDAKPPIPVGISRYFFEGEDDRCNDFIKFYPTNDPESCAGWNTYYEDPPNASTLRKILEDMTTKSYPIPEVRSGQDSLNFIGGTIASDISYFQVLFDAMRVLNDNVYDFDTDPNTWTCYVPVYDWPDCSNPNKPILIVGFAMIKITAVTLAPEKTVVGNIVCDKTLLERGGCGGYGLNGAIPNLVQ